jgi:hypothetical protein
VCTFRRASSTRVPPTVWSPFAHVNTREKKSADVGTSVPWAGFEHVIPISTLKPPPGPRNDCDRNLELLKKFVHIHVSDFSGRHPFESCSVYAPPRWLTQETYCYDHHIFPCCGLQCKVVTVPKVTDGFILWQGKQFAFVTEYRYDDPLMTHVWRFKSAGMLCLFEW